MCQRFGKRAGNSWEGLIPLEKRQKKIKHKTLCKSYENGGLKNVDIFEKIW